MGSNPIKVGPLKIFFKNLENCKEVAKISVIEYRHNKNKKLI